MHILSDKSGKSGSLKIFQLGVMTGANCGRILHLEWVECHKRLDGGFEH